MRCGSYTCTREVNLTPMRTALIERDGVVWQEISSPVPIRSQALKATNFNQALNLANEAARIPFDLTRAPLLRPSCIRVDAGNWLFVLNVHHSIFDGWAPGIFWRELRKLYEGVPLSAVVIQYADYAQWQSGWLQSVATAAEKAFWRERLDGALPLLALNRHRQADSTSYLRGGVQSRLLGGQARQAVNDLARRSAATEFAVLLTAFLATLYWYTRDEQILVDVPVACRGRAETENVIGYFANTVALRTFLSPELTFSALLTETSTLLTETLKAVSEAMTHQELPFNVVVDSLVLLRQAQRYPLSSKRCSSFRTLRWTSPLGSAILRSKSCRFISLRERLISPVRSARRRQWVKFRTRICDRRLRCDDGGAFSELACAVCCGRVSAALR